MISDSLNWTTSCPDWKEKIIAKQSIIPVKMLFQDVGMKKLHFFAGLRLDDVTGKPMIGEVSNAWIFEYCGAIFGALNPQNNRRLINDFFLLISKKNAKSTIAAGIMLTEMEFDQRGSAEYLILAPTKEVADNSFGAAKGMIKNSPYLSAKYHIQNITRTITNQLTGATLKVIAADAATASGKKATGVIIDELHEWGKIANADAIITEATGGLLSRTDGFILKLSTQSTEPPAGVFKAELDLARKVRDGEIVMPHYLPVLFEFPPEMLAKELFRQPEYFYVTNPNLGRSVDVAQLRNIYEKSILKGESAEIEFYAKHLNVPVGINVHSDSWAGAEVWQQQHDTTLKSLDDLIARCDALTIGIDGGGLDDLLGFCVLGRARQEPKKWYAWCKAWGNKIVLQRNKQQAQRLQDFVHAGDLVLVENVGDEALQAAECAAQIRASGKLVGIGVDSARPTVICDALNQFGFADGYATGVQQGWKLFDDIDVAQQKLAGRTLWHGGQDLFAWCVGNAKIKQNGNAVSITKQLSGSAKIDVLIALFCAVNVLKSAPEPQGDFDDWLNNIVIV